VGEGGEGEGVVLGALMTVNNIANARREHAHAILEDPRLLAALRACMTHTQVACRRAAVSAVRELAANVTGAPSAGGIPGGATYLQRLRDAGIDATLRRICPLGGHGTHGHGLGIGVGTPPVVGGAGGSAGSSSATGPGPSAHQMGIEEDVDVRAKAGEALRFLAVGLGGEDGMMI